LRKVNRTALVALLAVVLALGAGCQGRGATTPLLEQGAALRVAQRAEQPFERTEGGGEPTTIDSFGFWSLVRLGSGSIEFEDVRDKAKSSIPYILEPDRARQGPGNWYQVGLHTRVIFGAGTGRAYLFASHNGYASALIEYEATGSGDRRSIVRKATSYIDGSSKVVVRSVEDELRYRNYLQYKAVQPGLNQLTFAVEVHGSLEVKRVEILPDSGIQYTRVGPARLTLLVRLPREPLKKGRRATLIVEARNLGDRKARDATVRLEYARDELRNIGPETKKLGDLAAKGRRRASFQVIPLYRGTILIGLQAGGRGGNSPGISKTLKIR
jgi:hypothetical protein